MSGRALITPPPPYDAEIEYLESSGTQYIDTEVIPYRGLETIIDFQYTSLSHVQVLFGSWSTSPYVQYMSCLYSNKWYYGSYSPRDLHKVNWKDNIIDMARHVVSIDGNGSISQDGLILETTDDVSNENTNLSVYVFARNYLGRLDVHPSSMRCYSFKMKDNDTPIFDAIPVRVGTTGYMYDKVSGQLFGNAGTGAFILGPDKTN